MEQGLEGLRPARASDDALSFQGAIFDVDGTRRLIGKGSDGRYNPAIADRKKAIFKARYLPGLRAFPKVEALLEMLRARGVKLAVASSAGEDELAALLEVAHASRYFSEEANADDAQHSKPDPDIVQAAVRSSACAAADGTTRTCSLRSASTMIRPIFLGRQATSCNECATHRGRRRGSSAVQGPAQSRTFCPANGFQRPRRSTRPVCGAHGMLGRA